MEHLVVEPVEPGGSAAAEVEQLNVITAPENLNLSGSVLEVRERWAEFKKEWARYSSALFLSLVGNDALDVYNKMKFSEERDKSDLDVIFKKFDNYFYGECRDQSTLTTFDGREEVYARWRFHSRSQRRGESLTHFIEDVKRLSRDCQFCSCQRELLIRDRIVAGVIEEDVREEMLKVPQLPLALCIDICKASGRSTKRRVQRDGDRVRPKAPSSSEPPSNNKLPIPRDPHSSNSVLNIAPLTSGVTGSGAILPSSSFLKPAQVLVEMGRLPDLASLASSTASTPTSTGAQMVMVLSNSTPPSVSTVTVSSPSHPSSPTPLPSSPTPLPSSSQPSPTPSQSPSTTTESITCKVCGLVMGRSKNMKRHMKTHAKTWPCKYCGQEIEGFVMWQKHSVSCTQRKCKVCGKKFVKAYHLARHIKIHGESRDFTCELCGKAFKQQSSLYNHKRSAHFNEVMIFCDVCGQGCISQLSLDKHRCSHFPHHGPVKCNTCGKVFSRQRHLKKHEQLAHAEKKFSCSACPKKFSCQRYLDVHSRIHSGERPYSCKYCPKTFISDTSLLYHERRHTGITPHVCSVCYKRFVNTSHLKSHMLRHRGCNGTKTSEGGTVTASGAARSGVSLTSAIEASALTPATVHPSLVSTGIINQAVLNPALITPSSMMSPSLVSPVVASPGLVSAHLTSAAIVTSSIHPSTMTPAVVSQVVMNLNKPSSDEQAVFLAGVQNFATSTM